MLAESFSEGSAVATAINRQSSAGRHRVGVGRADYQRAKPAKFLLQQACGTVAAQSAKAIAAHQFSEITAVVRRGASNRTHLHQSDRNTCSGDLPSRLGTGQTGTKNGDMGRLRQPAASSSLQPTKLACLDQARLRLSISCS